MFVQLLVIDICLVNDMPNSAKDTQMRRFCNIEKIKRECFCSFKLLTYMKLLVIYSQFAVMNPPY